VGTEVGSAVVAGTGVLGVLGVRAGDSDGAGEPDGDGAVVGTALGRGAALVGAGRLTAGVGFRAGRLVVLDGACGLVPAMDAGIGRTSRYVTSAIRKIIVMTTVDLRIRQRGGRCAHITGYRWGRRCPGRSAR
jgi:hypothetical protein